MLFIKYIIIPCVLCIIVLSAGCLKEKSWYERWNWKAEDYFDDPKVILLCQAMEREDTEAIDRLIAEGVNVNTIGNKGMQPVLWAYAAGDKVFARILEAGGDPNFSSSDKDHYGTKGEWPPKKTLLGHATVAVMAHESYPAFKNYVTLLLRYGADPEARNGLAIFNSLGFDAKKSNDGLGNDEVIRQFIEAGIDLNINDGTNHYPVTAAATYYRYPALLLLLEEGAEYDTMTVPGLKLQNILHKRKNNNLTESLEEKYQEVIRWLEQRGVSFEKEAEHPAELLRQPAEFRKNDNLIKKREENAKRRNHLDGEH